MGIFKLSSALFPSAAIDCADASAPANIEHYSAFGSVNGLRSLVQETYLTTDTEAFGHDINFGVGYGWTVGSNDWNLKAILNLPFQASS